MQVWHMPKQCMVPVDQNSLGCQLVCDMTYIDKCRSPIQNKHNNYELQKPETHLFSSWFLNQLCLSCKLMLLNKIPHSCSSDSHWHSYDHKRPLVLWFLCKHVVPPHTPQFDLGIHEEESKCLFKKIKLCILCHHFSPFSFISIALHTQISILNFDTQIVQILSF